MPRAWMPIARSVSPIQRAAFSMFCGGTPVICAARSRRPIAHGLAHRIEAGRVGVAMYSVIRQAVADDHVQHRQEQRQVGAGPHRQIKVRVARDRRHARIDDDQLPAALAALPQIVRRDRRAFGRVRAGDHDHVGFRQDPSRDSSHGRCRTSACKPCRPTPCRGARCSRCSSCRAPRARTCRARMPSR